MLFALAVVFGAVSHIAAAACAPGVAPDVVDGDIVFQTSRSAQSSAIQHATHSRYSHVGVVMFRKGLPFVYEAEERVRYTPLAAWIERGEDCHYAVGRLRRPVDAAAHARLATSARAYLGRRYDAAFAWSDERMYCSELVWKLFRDALGVHLSEPQHLRDFDLRNALVAAKLRERYGAAIPLDEEVVSPQAIFASSELAIVTRH